MDWGPVQAGLLVWPVDTRRQTPVPAVTLTLDLELAMVRWMEIINAFTGEWT